MKKLLACMLAALMLLSLAACGAPQTGDSNAAGSNFGDSTVTTNGVAEDTTTAPEETAASTAPALISEEHVVIDDEFCTIKITGVEPDGILGYGVKIYLENKTDKDLMFSVESAAVNGVQTDPFFATEVAAGKKSNETISFMDSTLEENGIVDYTDIELAFEVSDADDWMADPVSQVSGHFYPYGEEYAVSFVREAQDTDVVLVDNEYMTVTAIGYEMDDIWGYSAKLFLVNKTDSAVMFSADDVSVNGFMVDPFFACSVDAGKCTFSSITWLENSLSENNITEIETIEMTVRAYPEGDFMADDYFNETVTLNP